MIKGNLIAALDGNFKKAQPEHTTHTVHERETGKWYVVRGGPRYLNTYIVTEYDAAGEKWLLEHEEKET